MGKILKEKLKGLKFFEWRLFFALCALGLVPAVYQTIKTALISSVAPPSVFNVIGQMEWFDLINETLQAFLIIPLYSVLNRSLKKDGDVFARSVFKFGLAAFLVYAVFSCGVLIYGNSLITAMNVEAQGTPREVTARYLRLETAAFMIGVAVSYFNVVFVVVGKAKNVYAVLIAKTALSVIADFLLIPTFGVYGVAGSNIIVNFVIAAVSFCLLKRQKYISFCGYKKGDLPEFFAYIKSGFFSGAQQFIDNFVYAVMVCKMVNEVADQGVYWAANNFIWGWLLIPVTALAEVIRRDCRDGYFSLKKFDYYFISIVTIALWGVTAPLWSAFFGRVEKLADYAAVCSVTLKLVPFYIAYAGCSIIDNIFIGLGKTEYNAVNSLIINCVYYGIFYLLYALNILSFNINVIILMFGFGMVAHLAVSLTEEKILKSRLLKNSFVVQSEKTA